MDERSARLAENETIFPAGKERIDALTGTGQGRSRICVSAAIRAVLSVFR
jgi:hypothetical protein